MGLLKENQKKEVRYDGKIFKLYEPDDEQRESLSEIIIDNSKIVGDELQGVYNLNVIRFVLREISNLGVEVDEYNDEELEKLLENGNRDVELLIRSVVELLEEISEDIMYSTVKNIKMMNDMLNVINVDGDMTKLKNKWNKLNKKYKMGMTFEELMGNINKKEELKNKLNETI